jgi:hypothetical protein
VNPLEYIIQQLRLIREDVHEQVERKWAIDCAECPGFRVVDGVKVKCECRREDA